MVKYPIFDPISIISIVVSFACVFMLYFFVSKVMHRIRRVEKKVVEVVKSHNQIHESINAQKRRMSRSDKIEYMEGDIDLIANDKKATFKAVYFPKKIRKKRG